jgi:hypothetical protein
MITIMIKSLSKRRLRGKTPDPAKYLHSPFTGAAWFSPLQGVVLIVSYSRLWQS